MNDEVLLLPVRNNANMHDGFLVPVRVINRRTRFGKEHVLVEPVAGQGTRWVDANTLQKGQ